MNEEQHNNETDEIKTPFFDMKKEFEVQQTSIDVLSKEVRRLALQVAKYEGKSQLIAKEVELDSHFHSRTTTRELARQAIIQSTAEANWLGLEKHPVVMNLYKAIKDRRNEQEQRIEKNLFRFENQPTYNEFIESMKGSSAFMDMNNEISNLWSRVESNTTSQGNDRTHANKQDLKQRDKMATMETAIHMLDFVMGETFDSHNSAFIFLMGAFAEMGKGEIEKGLRFMLRDRKPKVEKDDGKKITETPESSEG